MPPLMKLSPAAPAKARMVFTCWFLKVEELAVEIATEIWKKEKRRENGAIYKLDPRSY
jgi:hypothetical protein